jgi:anti-anti-sigma regulatory factor
VTTPLPHAPAPRGIVRLLNTSGGRVLCLAGEVDAAAVDSFLRRYGREPVRVDVIDAGSVTSLSAPALAFLRDHLDAAGWAGRPVALHGPPEVRRLLDRRGAGADPRCP